MGERGTNGQVIQDCLVLCDKASKLLRGAGFELRNVSMKTEACYYALPGRKALLRVATHSQKKTLAGLGNNVVSKLTFCGGGDAPGRMKCTDEKVRLMTATAIGIYLLSHER